MQVLDKPSCDWLAKELAHIRQRRQIQVCAWESDLNYVSTWLQVFCPFVCWTGGPVFWTGAGAMNSSATLGRPSRVPVQSGCRQRCRSRCRYGGARCLNAKKVEIQPAAAWFHSDPGRFSSAPRKRSVDMAREVTLSLQPWLRL